MEAYRVGGMQLVDSVSEGTMGEETWATAAVFSSGVVLGEGTRVDGMVGDGDGDGASSRAAPDGRMVRWM